MKYEPDKHHRHSIRLKEYDYAWPGGYFVTVCTEGRECLFGEIIEGAMRPNVIGQIVAEEWLKSARIRKEIDLDEWVVMPNHLHGIVIIAEESKQGAPPCAPTFRSRPKSLSSFMQGFKSATTTRINILRRVEGVRVWQRNYYEHIIRDLNDLERVRAKYHVQW